MIRTGGWAEKLGNRYEGFWAAKQLLELCAGNLQKIQIESVQEDGIDLFVWDTAGTCRAHQCKRASSRRNWTPAALKSEGVLKALTSFLGLAPTNRFVFISNVPAIELRRLLELAAELSPDTKTFERSIDRTKGNREAWEKLSRAMGIDFTRGLDLLSRTETKIVDDSESSRQDVRNYSRAIVEGDPADVVLRLCDFCLDHLQKPIHADQVREFLRTKTSFRPVDYAGDVTIAATVERLRDEYLASFRSNLIRGALIRREETRALCEAISLRQHRLHFLHGSGGQGKSGVLGEVTEVLIETGVPCLPLRFDERSPRNNSHVYGREQLGLPGSPVRCLEVLSADRPAVLIIDQLDAIRWNQRHDPSAWLVFQELVREVLVASKRVQVVVGCRTFDLRNDPVIQGWRQQLSQTGYSETEVADLPIDAVRDCVRQRDLNPAEMAPAVLALLRKPLNLSLWFQIPVDRLASLELRTSTGLLRAYWEHVYEDLKSSQISFEEINAGLSALIARIDQDGDLAVNRNVLSEHPRLRARLESLGVLRSLGSRIAFVHQSHFDYLLTSTLAKEAVEKQGICSWLALTEQSLFRRTQLRLVLALLREEKPDAAIGEARSILNSPDIRTHLKHLVLQVYGEVADPTEEEAKWVVELLEHKTWSEPVQRHVLFGKPAWFTALEKTGLWKTRLYSESDSNASTAAWLCRSVAHLEGDRVTGMLEPLLGQGERGLRLAQAALPMLLESDSQRLFAFRMAIVEATETVEFDDIHLTEALCRSQPERAIEYLATVVRNALTKPRKEGGRRPHESWPWWLAHHVVQHLHIAIDLKPAEFLYNFLPLILEEVKTPAERWHRTQGSFAPDQHWHGSHNRGPTDTESALPALAARALGKLLSQDPAMALKYIHELSESPFRTVQQIVAAAWLESPDDSVEEVAAWLMQNPNRLSLARLGEESHTSLSKSLVARVATLCSKETLRLLEATIMGFHPQWEWEDANRALRSGRTPNRVGLSKYILLDAIPPDRRSRPAAEQLRQLREKFGPLERLEDETDPMGGWVHSPVSDRTDRLSDDAWLTLTRQVESRERAYRRGHVIESSPESFASDLKRRAELEPRRFAQLGLRLSPDTLPCYVDAILSCLRHLNPPQNAGADWQPASPEQCNALLEHVGFSTDEGVARQWCWTIHERRDVTWSPANLVTLARYAIEHASPRSDREVLTEDSKDRLDSEAMNVVRGTAAISIAQLLFADEGAWPGFMECVDHLCSDPVPSVRVAAVGTLIPLLNIDRTEAFRRFLRLCMESDDTVLGSRNVGAFLRYVLADHAVALDPLLDRMVNSAVEGAVETGSAWSAIVWVHFGHGEERFRKLCQGSLTQQKAVADALGDNVLTKAYARCIAELPAFFDSDLNEVRRNTSGFLRNDLRFDNPLHQELLRLYVGSLAFLDEPTWLLMKLTEFDGDLQSLASIVLLACDRLADPALIAQAPHPNRLAYDYEKLASLLLRLYGQADRENAKETRTQCLNRWDSMLANNPNSFYGVLTALDT